jgi:prepilin-type N-terminal cleavage/methylation domain-containing protein
MKKFFTKNSGSGFTLVETLVALSVFSVTLVIIMSLLGRGVSDINYAKRKMVAEYLAQEGIEYVRNIRDTYLLSDGTSGWTNFNNRLYAGECNTANGCYLNAESVDTSSLIIDEIVITKCPDSGCPNLLYNANTGKYGYTSGSDSGFSIKIQMDAIASNETEISSKVSWTQGTKAQSTAFTVSLFNWVK